MSWAKIDDSFYDHPKIYAVGNAGAGLFARMLSWSCKHLTNGVITRQHAVSLEVDDSIPLTQKLVEVGLLESNDDGSFTIHDFSVYNPSAQKEKEKRAKNAERQARYAGRARASKPVTNAVTDAPPNGVSDGVSNAYPVPVPVPVPNTKKDPPNPQGGQVEQVSLPDFEPPKAPPPKHGLLGTLAKAYGDGVREASGTPFVDPTAPYELRELKRACEAHCGAANTMEAQLWLKRSAAEYRKATAAEAKYQSGFSPTAWAKWLQAGKPAAHVPPKEIKPPYFRPFPGLEPLPRRGTQ